MENPEDILFDDTWSLWYHKKVDIWKIHGYENIYQIKNLKDYWLFFNNIDKLGGITASHYFLMRNTIQPIYEDASNARGHAWTLLVSRNENGRDNCEEIAKKCWEEITLKALGETLLKDSKKINGITINVKDEGIIIQIWTSIKTSISIDMLPNSIRTMSKTIRSKVLKDK